MGKGAERGRGGESEGEWKCKDCLECSRVNCKWTPKPHSPPDQICSLPWHTTAESSQPARRNASGSQLPLYSLWKLINPSQERLRKHYTVQRVSTFKHSVSYVPAFYDHFGAQREYLQPWSLKRSLRSPKRRDHGVLKISHINKGQKRNIPHNNTFFASTKRRKQTALNIHFRTVNNIRYSIVSLSLSLLM